MFKKKKRVLWLLNHRTLMHFELPLIRSLGFEVFAPKIIPSVGRSFDVSFSHDASLSIPQSILARLNGFDFYEGKWPTDIIKIINRYFGTVFVMPLGLHVSEAVDKFEGQIVLRAYGLDNQWSYSQALEELYGPQLLHKIQGISERFWFGEGYRQLDECEPSFFKNRALFLPLGLSESFFKEAGRWNGASKRILFVCPDAITNPYYAKIYQDFKRDFGDLPHLILGAQDVPVDDPHMAGFVSDDELHRIYRDCAVLYYHSTELRHVHYSPIEAVITGMPVVFYRSSLLGRLMNESAAGGVSSVAEARTLIERLLSGEETLIERMRREQSGIGRLFTHAYCKREWMTSMESRGFNKALTSDGCMSLLWTELKRAMLLPIAHGLVRINPHRATLNALKASMGSTDAKKFYGSSLEDGFDFCEKYFPGYWISVEGLSRVEPWGRWSDGDTVVFEFGYWLKGRFRLYLNVFGYGQNLGQMVFVKVGHEITTFRLGTKTGEARHVCLDFVLDAPSSTIVFKVPHPTQPPNDFRKVGIGFQSMRSETILDDAKSCRSIHGASLDDGIDFSTADFPAFVGSVAGFSGAESFGRWSDGEKVCIRLRHLLSGRFDLHLKVLAYGPNLGAEVPVTIGSQVKMLKLGPEPDQIQDVSIEFDLSVPADTIEIAIPFPIQPKNDGRKIGLAFVSMRSEAHHTGDLALDSES